MEKQRTQKHQDIDNFITDGKNKADYYRLQSKEKIKNEYDNINNADNITELISEKDLSFKETMKSDFGFIIPNSSAIKRLASI